MHAFYEAYHTHRKPIREDSPELLFLRAACNGDAAAAEALFGERTQFQGEQPAVDAPHGRFEGLEAIGTFARQWLGSFGASRAELLPVVQTRGGGRAVTECVVSFFEGDMLLREIPMLAVGDLRSPTGLDELRLYFHFKQSPGFSAYRAPIFKSMHLTEQEPHLLTGAVRAYLEALHTEPALDVERVLSIIGDPFRFGGYVAEQGIIQCNRAELRTSYERMSTYIPRWLKIRFETVIDDGMTCVIEWVHIITRNGRDEGGRLCESGVAVYERGEDGRLSGIRICDYAHCESEIDWSRERISKVSAELINYLDA